MRWELDHVFIATADPAFELVGSEFGMTFTERRVHRGQGTSNACAVFENAFFELLYPANADELESEVVRPLGLKERINWRQTGACPFGICFRPAEPLADDGALPFETWAYRPPYVPPGSSIPIVTPAGCLLEPLVFLTNRPRTSGTSPESALHLGSKRTLTALSLQNPHSVHSSGLRWFIEHGLLMVTQGPEYLLELVCDDGRTGKYERRRTPLPLSVRW